MIHNLVDWLFGPFTEFAFMRRALVAALALALGSGPVGTFLVVRRMSLMGDALGHAVLPGAAAGFLLAGLSLPAMSLGGAAAGLMVALGAGFVTRSTRAAEDSSFAALYLIALALGVTLVAMGGSPVDLLHVLFGSVLAVDEPALILVTSISAATLIALALLWRPLVIECFDPAFLKVAGGHAGLIAHLGFLTLVVANLVAGFQALGTLMAVGLMMLPAAAARFWVRTLPASAALASGFAAVSAICGLLASYHADLPSGPAIVLSAGAIWVVSVGLGTHGSLRKQAG